MWGITYNTNIQPLRLLQKRIVRIITFFKFDAHTNPLFLELKILKLIDIAKFNTAIFMYQYAQGMLPDVFHSFFTFTTRRHKYSTGFALKSTLCFSKIRTNYGKFNIRYFGPKIWNDIEDSVKCLTLWQFKKKLKECYFNSYEES